MVQLTITPPTLLAFSSHRPNSCYALDGNLFHPSVYFSATNSTLWFFLFDELRLDIRLSMSHTSFRPSQITLFFQSPSRFNLCYQRKFPLFYTIISPLCTTLYGLFPLMNSRFLFTPYVLH